MGHYEPMVNHDSHAMPGIATVAMAENYIKNNSIGLQCQAECWCEQKCITQLLRRMNTTLLQQCYWDQQRCPWSNGSSSPCPLAGLQHVHTFQLRQLMAFYVQPDAFANHQ